MVLRRRRPRCNVRLAGAHTVRPTPTDSVLWMSELLASVAVVAEVLAHAAERQDRTSLIKDQSSPVCRLEPVATYPVRH